MPVTLRVKIRLASNLKHLKYRQTSNSCYILTPFSMFFFIVDKSIGLQKDETA